jgi:hypothetical protein
VQNTWFFATYGRGNMPVALEGWDKDGRLIARDRILNGPTPGG